MTFKDKAVNFAKILLRQQTDEQLKGRLQNAINVEDYESAAIVKQVIDERVNRAYVSDGKNAEKVLVRPFKNFYNTKGDDATDDDVWVIPI